MKRWCVWHNAKGEVQSIEPGLPMFTGAPPTEIEPREGRNRFYCTAVDELSAMARFTEAWKKKEQTNA